MNDFQLLPNDPKLTAYALGELEPNERAQVEAALRANPALEREVEEIRVAAQHLEAAFATEAADIPGDSGINKSDEPEVVPAGEPSREADAYRQRGGAGKILRFPQVYYIVGGLAAACFAVMVALHRDEFEIREQARVESLRVAMQKRGEAALAQSGTTVMTVELPTASVFVAAADASQTAGGGSASAPAQQETITTLGAVAPEGLSLLAQAKTETAALVREKSGAAQTARAERDSAQAARFSLSDDSARTAGSPDRAGLIASNGGTMVASSPPMPSAVFGGSRTLGGVVAGAGESLESSTLSRLPSTRALDARFAPAGGLDLYPGPRRSLPEPIVPPSASVPHNTESYSFIRDNAFLGVTQNPLSTFSVDVDTASYTNVRRLLATRSLPPPDAVRIEELLNYFSYRYPAPTNGAPFAVSMEVATAPWATQHRLVRIGLKGREVAAAARPAANLVFLIDVSGSMNQPNKLPLVKESLRLLLGKLRPDDRVAIVTYAGSSALALPSTPVARSREILAAVDTLQSGGSTNGAMGIHLAYDIAKANFLADGVNRVILCTDGDFNVGVTGPGDLVRLIEEKAKSKVFLTVLGFGMGNLKDGTLEQLANKGNGHYGYIDNRREAQRMLVDDLTSTLVTIAKDVKIQVEFNPAKVASYRLIGYENRVLAKEDFNNDQVDAGEIGAGHTVTALYEIVPVSAADSEVVAAPVDELRYQTKPVAPVVPAALANELLTVKVRYKEPHGDVSEKLDFPLTDAGKSFEQASGDFRFAAAVAQFGMILRKSEHRGTATLGHVMAWAADTANITHDPRGERGEFLELARQALELLRTE
jgi:Ca-activated chloride channel family protein